MKQKTPKPTTVEECVELLDQIANDDRHRVLLTDEIAWQKKKLAEIARLVKILRKLLNVFKTLTITPDADKLLRRVAAKIRQEHSA